MNYVWHHCIWTAGKYCKTIMHVSGTGYNCAVTQHILIMLCKISRNIPGQSRKIQNFHLYLTTWICCLCCCIQVFGINATQRNGSCWWLHLLTTTRLSFTTKIRVVCYCVSVTHTYMCTSHVYNVCYLLSCSVVCRSLLCFPCSRHTRTHTHTHTPCCDWSCRHCMTV